MVSKDPPVGIKIVTPISHILIFRGYLKVRESLYTPSYYLGWHQCWTGIIFIWYHSGIFNEDFTFFDTVGYGYLTVFLSSIPFTVFSNWWNCSFYLHRRLLSHKRKLQLVAWICSCSPNSQCVQGNIPANNTYHIEGTVALLCGHFHLQTFWAIRLDRGNRLTPLAIAMNHKHHCHFKIPQNLSFTRWTSYESRSKLWFCYS